jgi:hypothetical protein
MKLITRPFSSDYATGTVFHKEADSYHHLSNSLVWRAGSKTLPAVKQGTQVGMVQWLGGQTQAHYSETQYPTENKDHLLRAVIIDKASRLAIGIKRRPVL